MRHGAMSVVVLVLLGGTAQAQLTWQPAQPPRVTADNESWFKAGQAIEWNGDLYYPAGAAEGFNRYQMVRAGSYRGIPLYTDATLEPNSIVFVPIAGGRMQPYERPRTGTLAGSAGSRTSSFPSPPASEASGLTTTADGFVVQAPAPPTFARPYEIGSTTEPESPLPAPAATPSVVGTTGRAARANSATTARPTAVTNRPTSAARPKGINGIWLDYGGHRWVSAGRAVELTADFTRVGQYRGFPVYQRGGDTVTIYVPSAGQLLVPYKQE